MENSLIREDKLAKTYHAIEKYMDKKYMDILSYWCLYGIIRKADSGQESVASLLFIV